MTKVGRNLGSEHESHKPTHLHANYHRVSDPQSALSQVRFTPLSMISVPTWPLLLIFPRKWLSTTTQNLFLLLFARRRRRARNSPPAAPAPRSSRWVRCTATRFSAPCSNGYSRAFWRDPTSYPHYKVWVRACACVLDL